MKTDKYSKYRATPAEAKRITDPSDAETLALSKVLPDLEAAEKEIERLKGLIRNNRADIICWNCYQPCAATIDRNCPSCHESFKNQLPPPPAEG